MTVVVLNPSADSYIINSAPTTNPGLESQLYVGELNGTSDLTRTLVKFDLSVIPANAIISSVVFSLFIFSDRSDTATTLNIYRLKRNWVETQVTWNQYSSGNNWQTQGGNGSNDREGSPIASRAFSATEPLNVYVNFTMPTSLAALDLGNGWILKTSVENNDGYDFRSRQGGISERPTLTITYTIPNPVVSQAITVSESKTVSVQAATPVTPATSDSVSLAENLAFFFPDIFFNTTAQDLVAVTEAQTLAVTGIPPALELTVVENVALTENTSGYMEVGVLVSDLVSLSEFLIMQAGTLIPVSDTVFVGESVHVRPSRQIVAQKYYTPLLYLTNGVDKFDLLSKTAGYSLCDWVPAIAQYKGEGIFNDSPVATGRRLVYHQFQNNIESFNLTASAHNQDTLIRYTTALLRWLELAASFWENTWSPQPIYLVARAPQETNTRYAVLHKGSIDRLGNPYIQPFTPRSLKPSFTDITLTLELGHWTDLPPGESDCVPLRATQDWVPGGLGAGEISGGGTSTIYSLVQANNGTVLAGTNDAAKIFSTVDSGNTWVLAQTLGGGADQVNAFTKDGVGNLYAAVSGTGGGKGIWKSTNNGVTWVKVRVPSGSFAASTGYFDISWRPFVGAGATQYLVAVGDGLGIGLIEFSIDGGTVWSTQPSFSTLTVQPYVAITPTSYFTNERNFFVVGKMLTQSPTVVFEVNPGNGTPSSFQWVPPSTEGNFGQGALDIIQYGRYVTGYGGVSENLLAVKASNNSANTEIWTWVHTAHATVAGSGYWRRRATIAGKTISILYPDPLDVPASGTFPVNRTIWAGTTAGEILVSYDTGYNWQVYSTLASGGVEAILRTSGGALLFGGGINQFFSQGTSTADDVYEVGQSATCENAVYVANKHSNANLTHVKQFTNVTGGFVSLQYETNPPYQLLPDPPAFNDAVYFGIRTTLSDVDANGFSSLVLDITVPQNDITGVTWEYWSGFAWTALTVQDNTNGFSNQGVNSVHWMVPTNWAITTVDGVTGYWVRARVNSIGPSPISPIHSGTYVYTITSTYVEVEEGAVGGVLPALAQIKWYNRADDSGVAIAAEIDRVMVGLRSYSRGPAFNAYLNISDTQVPFGFSLSKDNDGAWSSQVGAPTGRYLSVSHASAARLSTWNDLVTFSLGTTIARDFYGQFRLFVRVKRTGGTSITWRLRGKTIFGSGGGSVTSKTAYVTTTDDWEVVDLGLIAIPSAQLSQFQNNLGDQVSLSVQGYATSTGVALALYDLILIPVDEWAIDSQLPELALGTNAEVVNGNYLDIDSISNLRASPVMGLNRTNSDLVRSIYQTITNGPAILQAEARQRLWFLVMKFNSGPYWKATPHIAGSVQVFKQQRYLGLRGDE